MAEANCSIRLSSRPWMGLGTWYPESGGSKSGRCGSFSSPFGNQLPEAFRLILSNPMDLLSLHRAHVEELTRNVAQALEKNGITVLTVHSGTPQKRTGADDQYWPLRATPHFQHWLPLAEPGCLLIVEPGKRPVLVRPPAQSFWEAPAAPES